MLSAGGQSKQPVDEFIAFPLLYDANHLLPYGIIGRLGQLRTHQEFDQVISCLTA